MMDLKALRQTLKNLRRQQQQQKRNLIQTIHSLKQKLALSELRYARAQEIIANLKLQLNQLRDQYFSDKVRELKKITQIQEEKRLYKQKITKWTETKFIEISQNSSLDRFIKAFRDKCAKLQSQAKDNFLVEKQVIAIQVNQLRQSLQKIQHSCQLQQQTITSLKQTHHQKQTLLKQQISKLKAYARRVKSQRNQLRKTVPTLSQNTRAFCQPLIKPQTTPKSNTRQLKYQNFVQPVWQCT